METKTPAGRLTPLASRSPELSDEEAAILSALSDDQKLAVGHAIRLTNVELKQVLRERIAKLESWTVDDPSSPFLGEDVVSLADVLIAFDVGRLAQPEAADAVREDVDQPIVTIRDTHSSSSSSTREN